MVSRSNIGLQGPALCSSLVFHNYRLSNVKVTMGILTQSINIVKCL